MYRYEGMKEFVSNTPTKKELQRLSINDLMILATKRRKPGVSLKKILIGFVHGLKFN